MRNSIRSAVRAMLYCALLIPLGLASLVIASLDAARVAAWSRGLRTGLLGKEPVAAGRPSTPGVLGHAVASLLLGVAAVPAFGIELLFLARGLLYGFVDRGPYTTSWGGPSRTGAWLVHFLVSMPIAVIVLAAFVGIAAIHQRLTRSLDGVRPAGWVVPVTLLLPIGATAVVVLWTHQI